MKLVKGCVKEKNIIKDTTTYEQNVERNYF